MTIRNNGTATGRKTFAVRVAANTPGKLADLALERGFYYIGEGGERFGAAGQLLDALAEGRIELSTGG